jgi:hypothetical protein
MSQKHVSFKAMAFVVLIPKASELHDAGLGPDLWWSDDDYRSFKMVTYSSLREFLQLNPALEPRKAMKHYIRMLDEKETSETCAPMGGDSFNKESDNIDPSFCVNADQSSSKGLTCDDYECQSSSESKGNADISATCQFQQECSNYSCSMSPFPSVAELTQPHSLDMIDLLSRMTSLVLGSDTDNGTSI